MQTLLEQGRALWVANDVRRDLGRIGRDVGRFGRDVGRFNFGGRKGVMWKYGVH